jgi:hypothetical protein
MAKQGSRPRPEAPSFAPPTITEITRRYYACALALAKAMGLPLSAAFVKEHRESISCCFIEAGRAGVRLPATVTLPPLSTPATPEPAPAPVEVKAPAETPALNGDAPVSMAIPVDAGLPCAGQGIEGLRPAQLSLLLGKVARLAEAQGGRWTTLLEALQRERMARLAQGQRRPDTATARD